MRPAASSTTQPCRSRAGCAYSDRLLTLQSRQQGYETHRAERLTLDPRLTLGVTIELLAAIRPHGRDQSAAHTQLLEQRGRHGMRRRRQQDPVVRCARCPAEVAVIMTEIDVSNSQLAQGASRAS